MTANKNSRFGPFGQALCQPRIDTLCHNAGIYLRANLLDYTQRNMADFSKESMATRARMVFLDLYGYTQDRIKEFDHIEDIFLNTAYLLDCSRNYGFDLRHAMSPTLTKIESGEESLRNVTRQSLSKFIGMFADGKEWNYHCDHLVGFYYREYILGSFFRDPVAAVTHSALPIYPTHDGKLCSFLGEAKRQTSQNGVQAMSLAFITHFDDLWDQLGGIVATHHGKRTTAPKIMQPVFSPA